MYSGPESFFRFCAICSNPLRNLTDGGYWPATGVGVARESRMTRAHWRVIDHSTFRVQAASARTRINALLTDTSASRRAIRGRNALRTATRRDADHTGRTRALGRIMNHLTSRVRAARVRMARIGRKRSQCSYFGYRRPDGSWMFFFWMKEKILIDLFSNCFRPIHRILFCFVSLLGII